MKSTTFLAAALILALGLVSIDSRLTTATIPADSTQIKSVRVASLKENRDIAILADEAQGLDDKCTAPPLSSNPDENWKAEKTFQFTDRGTSYKLVYSWQLPDSTSLCLVSGKTAVPLVYKEGAYIDKVERVRVKLFNVSIHEGNGSNVPATKYQLDLGQPQNPRVKVLKRWIMK